MASARPTSAFPRPAAGAWLVLSASLLVLILGAGDASAGGKHPLRGQGQWIWYVSASGGDAKGIAKKARKHGLDHVLIKSADGGNVWSQFTSKLVRGLKRRGIKVCAWAYVYGDRPRAEARATAAAKKRGAQCIAIDAEAEYEGKYRSADRYIRKLRRLVGKKYRLVLASFPYVDYHPSLPFSVFMGRGKAQANAPQMYWHAIGTSVAGVYAHTYAWNAIYHRRIFPLGQTYQDPPRKELTQFRRHSRANKATGESWWSWQETNNREWNRIGGARPEVGKAKRVTARAVLSRGESGDPVLLLQQLLRAWKYGEVKVTGIFNKKTQIAVRAFQERKGLKVDGKVGPRTWNKLNKRKPVYVRWSKKGAPKSARATAAARALSVSYGAPDAVVTDDHTPGPQRG